MGPNTPSRQHPHIGVRRPVGVNVFVVKAIAEDMPMSEIFIGILPFWLAMVVCLAILIAFPQIALFLPNTIIN